MKLHDIAVILFALGAVTSAQNANPDSQRAAVAKYPDLAKAQSAIHREFLNQIALARTKEPQLFSDSAWPLKIADRAASALAPKEKAIDTLMFGDSQIVVGEKLWTSKTLIVRPERKYAAKRGDVDSHCIEM